MTLDEFRLQFSGEIREAMITAEGEDGSFELLHHGLAADEQGDTHYALVRSIGTGCLYVLVRDPDEAVWHPTDLPSIAARLAQMRLGGEAGAADPDAAYAVRATARCFDQPAFGSVGRV